MGGNGKKPDPFKNTSRTYCRKCKIEFPNATEYMKHLKEVHVDKKEK